jgi:hypothetical protein
MTLDEITTDIYSLEYFAGDDDSDPQIAHLLNVIEWAKLAVAAGDLETAEQWIAIGMAQQEAMSDAENERNCERCLESYYDGDGPVSLVEQQREARKVK